MSLSNYANAAYSIGEELRDLLREREAFEPHLETLSSQSALALARFHRDNLALVERVASAPPAKRQKILDKLSVEAQFWAIAAAAKMAFEAHAVLERADLELRPVGSYRDKILSVQSVLSAPYEDEDYVWPFPTPPLLDP